MVVAVANQLPLCLSGSQHDRYLANRFQHSRRPFRWRGLTAESSPSKLHCTLKALSLSVIWSTMLYLVQLLDGMISMPQPHDQISTFRTIQYRTYPAPDHDIVWLATNAGRLEVGGVGHERELAVFAEGQGSIDIAAHGGAEFVIASVSHSYPLFNGSSLVRTSAAALIEDKPEIRHLQRSPEFITLASR